MLGQIRKFSSSALTKILLVIIIIPFVFWGMGPLFRGGNLNTIVQIDKDKISTQEFINYVENYAPVEQTLDKNLIDKLLSNFIGEKLIAREIENFGIKLSDLSLSKIIKNEEIFKKENKFSRVKYEKFLVENGLSAAGLEANISKQNKKEQLFNFIGGGIVPSKFLVNRFYDEVNQKRNIEIINLNDVYKQKMNFSKNQIETYFEENKNEYQNIYRVVEFIELNPKNLTNDNEFSDLFFEKIDEIDDLIVMGKNLNFILDKFNLESPNLATINKLDMNKSLEKINGFPVELIKKVFDINETEPTILIEGKNKFFVVELTKSKNIQTKITDPSVKKEILLALEKKTKRELFSEIVGKINDKKFTKKNFDQLSHDKNVVIKKIILKNKNDDKILKKELVKQIYTFLENKVAAIADIGMSESYLIYVDKIENVSINQNSNDYNKYFDLSKANMTSGLYNTYDSYLKNKYKIKINDLALTNIKDNFK